MLRTPLEALCYGLSLCTDAPERLYGRSSFLLPDVDIAPLLRRQQWTRTYVPLRHWALLEGASGREHFRSSRGPKGSALHDLLTQLPGSEPMKLWLFCQEFCLNTVHLSCKARFSRLFRSSTAYVTYGMSQIMAVRHAIWPRERRLLGRSTGLSAAPPIAARTRRPSRSL